MRKRLTRAPLALACAVAALWLVPQGAAAQGKVEAHYEASLAGIAVGKGTWAIEITDDSYSAAAQGATAGLLKAFSGGTGTGSAQGRIVNGALAPVSYAASINSKKSETIRINLVNGNIRDFVIEPEPPVDPDRIVVTEAQKKGVVDPMTSSLVRVPGTGDVISPEACRGGSSVFDGRLRYDLKHDFKRIETVRGEGLSRPGRGLRPLLHAARGLHPRPADHQISLHRAEDGSHAGADRGNPVPGAVPRLYPDAVRPRGAGGHAIQHRGNAAAGSEDAVKG